jgi:DNA-binding CsgD family transcriptional regulator
MAQPAAVLVGRERELDVLDRALDGLQRSEFGALEILGEPGIGKTRMLSELAARAGGRGHVVLAGSASELERDVPFWVFVDAMDDFVRGLEPQLLDALPDSVRAELATVFPALSHFAHGQTLALQHERYRSHRAVRELLEVLAARQPLVLLLDDVHWADPGSVELLTTLLRRPPSGAVLIALGVRPRQKPERLSIALARAVRAGTVVQAELTPLSRAQARAFLGDAADAADRAGIFSESGGNPFYLEQLARTLHRNPAIVEPSTEITWSGARVPGSVVAALAEEQALLSARARSVLQGAAIAGDPFDLELAAAAADVDEPTALDAMDELLTLDVIRTTDVPRRFRFRHPLLRRAVYEGTPAGSRIAAHGRVADALREQGAPVAALAHHVDNSAVIGDAAAMAVLRDAGMAAARRTPASAAHWFTSALRVLGDRGPVADRIGLLTSLAGAQAATGHFDGARTALLEAISHLSADALPERVGLTAACAGVEQLLGLHEQARRRLISALEELDDPASQHACALLINLAIGDFYQLRTAESRAWAMRAVEVAQQLDHRAFLACAAAVAALACSFEAATAEGMDFADEAGLLIDAMPDDELALRLDSIAYLTGAELYLDRYDDCVRHGLRGLALARSTDQDALVPMITQALGTALLAHGRLAEATEVLDGSVEGARLVGNSQTLAWSLLNRGFVNAVAGALDLALADAKECVELTRDAEPTLVSMYSGVVMAMVQLELGNHQTAVQMFVESGGGEGMLHISGAWRANYLDMLCRGYLGWNDRAGAERAASNAQAVAANTGLESGRGWAGRACARIALHDEAFGVAAAEASNAALAFEACGMSIEAAVSRLLCGRAIAAERQVDAAAAEFERALAVFDAANAARLRQEAERELRRIGRTIHRRSAAATGTGIAALTGRERELATLVLKRKTNAEIAATLFLSPKTVETHLRNIFRKVNVTTRHELADALERESTADRGSTVERPSIR